MNIIPVILGLLRMRICRFGYCLMYPSALAIGALLILFLMIIMFKTFVRFSNRMEKDEFKRARRRIRFFMMMSRILIFALLSIAIATPFAEKVTTIPGNPSLKILVDNSASFQLFEEGIGEELKTKLQDKIPTTLFYIAEGDESKLGDSILHNIEGDDNLLLISDGNNNKGRSLGDIMLFASTLNTTINMVDISPVNSDVSVKTTGPKEVIVGTDNEYVVKVTNVGDTLNYHIEIIVDNEIIIGEPAQGSKEFSFNRRFASEGCHRITAKITGPDEADHFAENNIYYKTVKVVPRPSILYVTEEDSPLLTILNTIYDLDVGNNIPSSIGHDAIIIDNIHADQLNSKVDLLNDYVSEKGNGLLVIGGLNSFDRGNYKNSLFETLLPASVGQAEIEQKKSANIVILIDISESTGYEVGGGEIDFEKALAIKMLEDFRPDDMVSIVAFNHLAYLVSPLTRLSEKRDIESKIASLKDIGGTVILAGLQRADQILSEARGSKYVILISDGMTQLKEESLEYADSLSGRGIKLYTVGIGGRTNRDFLKQLAETGRGIYFEPDESEHLRLLFGSSAEPLDDDLALVIFDSTHFITRGTQLRGKVSGFNFVVPKPAARPVITTNEGFPIITTWRYGIGRIAAMTTDNGNKWAGEMLSAENFKIMGRMVNWVVGDLSRNKRYDIKMNDISLGEQMQIMVVSDNFPEHETLSFSKIDANLYAAETKPAETGFYGFNGAFGAVNYAKEYETLGLNHELVDLVTVNGGHIFQPEEIDKIVDTVKTISKRKKLDFITFRWPFVALAIIIFLIEIFIRRIRENMIRVR